MEKSIFPVIDIERKVGDSNCGLFNKNSGIEAINRENSWDTYIFSLVKFQSVKRREKTQFDWDRRESSVTSVFKEETRSPPITAFENSFSRLHNS